MAAPQSPSPITRATLSSCAARQLSISPAQSEAVIKPRTASIAKLLSLACWVLVFTSPTNAQKNKKGAEQLPPTMARTTTRHETARLSFGGTVNILGAPAGSITIQGWQRNEVEVTADIELHAATPADLDRLAMLNNFVFDVDTDHIRILTTGTHDAKFMKRVAKNFPKTLLGLPWKIDFHINVPAMTDLEIDNGVGPIKLAGVEGAIRLTALQTDADLSLTGGYVSGIIQRGALHIDVPARSWHGLGATIQLAAGTLDVSLLPGFSADIDATVLRLGEIKNSYPLLTSRETNSITSRLLRARAGAGGAKLSFTVGDGTIEIRQARQ